jgi:Raf kinase inhibitor-like YbhB/YbcL family protein
MGTLFAALRVMSIPTSEDLTGGQSGRVATTRSVTLGDLALASRRLGVENLPRLELKSQDFRDGELLPTRATGDGDGTPPPLTWEPGASTPAAYVVICEDPDAPRATPFVHWIVYGIRGDIRSLDSNLGEFREGLNDHGERGFAPAAPPAGHGRHRYYFQVFALDRELTLPPGVDYDQLLSAMKGHVIAWGQIVGLYERP